MGGRLRAVMRPGHGIGLDRIGQHGIDSGQRREAGPVDLGGAARHHEPALRMLVPGAADSLTRLADRHYLIERGRVVWTGTSKELTSAPDIQHRFLGV